jgi:hypothetical protein
MSRVMQTSIFSPKEIHNLEYEINYFLKLPIVHRVVMVRIFEKDQHYWGYVVYKPNLDKLKGEPNE